MDIEWLLAVKIAALMTISMMIALRSKDKKGATAAVAAATQQPPEVSEADNNLSPKPKQPNSPSDTSSSTKSEPPSDPSVKGEKSTIRIKFMSGISKLKFRKFRRKRINSKGEEEENTLFERVAVQRRPARSKVKKKNALKWKVTEGGESNDSTTSPEKPEAVQEVKQKKSTSAAEPKCPEKSQDESATKAPSLMPNKGIESEKNSIKMKAAESESKSVTESVESESVSESPKQVKKKARKIVTGKSKRRSGRKKRKWRGKQRKKSSKKVAAAESSDQSSSSKLSEAKATISEAPTVTEESIKEVKKPAQKAAKQIAVKDVKIASPKKVQVQVEDKSIPQKTTPSPTKIPPLPATANNETPEKAGERIVKAVELGEGIPANIEDQQQSASVQSVSDGDDGEDNVEPDDSACEEQVIQAGPGPSIDLKESDEALEADSAHRSSPIYESQSNESDAASTEADSVVDAVQQASKLSKDSVSAAEKTQICSKEVSSPLQESIANVPDKDVEQISFYVVHSSDNETKVWANSPMNLLLKSDEGERPLSKECYDQKDLMTLSSSSSKSSSPSPCSPTVDNYVQDDNDYVILSAPACRVLELIQNANMFQGITSEKENALLRNFFGGHDKQNDQNALRVLQRAIDVTIARVKTGSIPDDLYRFLASNRALAISLMIDAMRYKQNQYLPKFWKPDKG